VRIAVLADVHGNLPALRAVLADLDREPVDVIVSGGDVVAGPLVRESLELLASRPEPIRWVRGNAERAAVAVFDGKPATDDTPGRAAEWSAQALDRRWRDELAGWPTAVELDGVLFCHGSPRSDEEIITRATPDEVVLEALDGVRQQLVVGGHTHWQFVRPLPAGPVYANAGSVGLPYEGHEGAFWMIVENGVPDPRVTDYDLDAAVSELRASGFPDLDEHLSESLLEPVDPDWVAAFLEHTAGRGEHPGTPTPARGDR
jgi:predicted phosphodiesterase